MHLCQHPANVSKVSQAAHLPWRQHSAVHLFCSTFVPSLVVNSHPLHPTYGLGQAALLICLMMCVNTRYFHVL